MGAGADREARALQPFLKRAEEVERADPLVAYYCRLRAAEEGLALEGRAPETTELLGEVLGRLETAKAELKLDEEADRMHCEGFAMSIFDKADRADRAGAASLGTAKAFYASSVFMEVCRQFGELDGDLEAKQKYAVWKASDIRKALKRGERPNPGPPGGEPATEAAPGALAEEMAGGGDSGEGEEAAPSVEPSQAAGAHEEAPATTGPLTPAGPLPPGAVPEGRAGPEAELEVDELGLPKAPIQGVPLSPTMGIDVEQFTLPKLPGLCKTGEETGPNGAFGGGSGGTSPAPWPSAPPPGSSPPAPPSGAPPSAPPPGPPPSAPPPGPPPSAPFPGPPPSAPPPGPPPSAPPPGPPPSVQPPGPSPSAPPPQPRSPPPPATAPALPHLAPGFKPSLGDVMAAQKNAKFAVSSLGFEDIPGAVDFLTKALEHLTGARRV